MFFFYQYFYFSKYEINTKFKEKIPNWVMPNKYLIGPEKFINNALSYEIENDARIDMLQLRTSTINGNINIQMTNDESSKNSNGNVAIPIKITVDRSNTKVQELIKILEIERKTEEDKSRFLKELKKCIDDDETDCSFIDKSGKFDFDTQTLTLFSTYRKKEEGPKNGITK